MQWNVVSSPWVRKASPVAFTVAAGIGIVGTAILAAKATPKAIERKEKAEKEKGEPLTTWEKVKVMASCYAPAAATGIATIGAVGGLAATSSKRQMEMAGLVTSGNQIINSVTNKYRKLRDNVKEKDPELLKDFDRKSLDDEWEEYINERTKKKVSCIAQCFPLDSSEEYGEKRMFGIEYGNGLPDENGHETIYFEATPGDVITAFYNLNAKFATEGLVCVNDLFHQLGLPNTELGRRLVWDPDVMIEEWDGCCFIGFFTEDYPMEEGAPVPLTCTIIRFAIDPLSDDYTPESRYMW